MKIKLLAATALVISSFSPALMTPAFAVVPQDVLDDMQQTCEDNMKPNARSDYVTEPTAEVTETVGDETLVSHVQTGSTPNNVLLSQTSVYGGDGTRHRHGGSPNIFGGFTVTSVYTGGSTTYLDTYNQTITYTFGCEVFKWVGPNNDERENAPPGLQTDGTFEVEGTTTRTETVSVPSENTTVVTQGDGVICISPSTTGSRGNPGVWRQQNGYTGECSTTLFYSLAGIPEPIPSNSLPPA